MQPDYLNKIDRATRPPRLSASDGGQERYQKFSLFNIQYSIWFWLCQVRVLSKTERSDTASSQFSLFTVQLTRNGAIYTSNP
jgi:hypothetical protein